MKKLLFLLLCVLLFLSNVPAAYSADAIIESPNVKIVIEGKYTAFKNTPLIDSGRMLLPLREVLTDLGVRNDDEHIIWDGSDQSVTIFKDSARIYLKVGSKTAYVNDNEIYIDCPPVNYKSSVFIPVRFVSQTLGKKVVWDDVTRTVLIREEKEYNKTWDILRRVNSAMAAINRYKFLMDARLMLASKEFIMKSEGSVDFKNMLMQFNLDVELSGKTAATSYFLANNNIYSKNSESQKWQKKAMAKEQFEGLLKGQTILSGKSEVLAAGLVEQESNNADEIILKGELFINDILNQLNSSVNLNGIEFEKESVEISVNKNDYLLGQSTMNIEAKVTSGKVSQPLTESITCTYSDYNGTFEVVRPDNLK